MRHENIFRRPDGALSKAITIPVIILVLFSIAFALLSKTNGNERYIISTDSSSCSSGAMDEINIRPEGSSVTIFVPLTTPNPCYIVGGNVNFVDGRIDVNIFPVPSKESTVCIQCIGEITGKVLIQNLEKGSYVITIKTPNKSINATVVVE